MPPRTSHIPVYTGILAEPMPKYSVLTRPSDREIDALIAAKMKALFAHFGLDPAEAYEVGPKMAAAWADLALHLARQHVPGFANAPEGRGKPAVRKQDDVTIVMQVELLKRRDGMSDRRAIKHIADKKLVPGTESALLRRYGRAKTTFKPMARMFDNMVAMIGQDAFVQAIEKVFSEDKKDIFLSPD